MAYAVGFLLSSNAHVKSFERGEAVEQVSCFQDIEGSGGARVGGTNMTSGRQQAVNKPSVDLPF